MDHKTIELYQKSELAGLRRKLAVQIAALAAVAAVTIGACIVICTKVTANNANHLLGPCVGVSILGSWIALTIRIFGIDTTRCAVKHTEAMLEGDRETVTGEFVLTDEHVQIRNGVSMFRVRHEGPEQTGILQLYDKKKERFDASAAVSVSVVYGFVVAYEEETSDD